MPTRDFRPLNEYARREYKFAQADSMGLVKSTIAADAVHGNKHYSKELTDGACTGVSLNWIKEKLSTSNGLLRADGPLRNPVTRNFSNPLNPVSRLKRGISPSADSLPGKFMSKGTGAESKSGLRNQSTQLAGAMTHSVYVNDINTALENRDYGRKSRTVVARELGLHPVEHEVEPAVVKGPDNQPVRDENRTIASAGTSLPKGSAMIIEVFPEGSKTGHTICYYRSRGDTLYFFDPNAGVYNVSEPDLEQFVGAWRTAYSTAPNAPLNFKTKAGNDWYEVYSRADDTESPAQAPAEDAQASS
jgi:Yersinia/Haemophilus virulence surface antigen